MRDPLTKIIETHLHHWAIEEHDPVTVVKWIFNDCMQFMTQGGCFTSGRFKADFIEDIMKDIQNISRQQLARDFPPIDLRKYFKEIYQEPKKFISSDKNN